MDSTVGKAIAVALIAGGEALAIYAEMLVARTPGALGEWLAPSVAPAVLPLVLLITLAGGFLLAGYWLGYATFQNIWVVSAASITGILIVEPVLAWSMFHESPTKGAVIGLVLGAIGFAASVFL